MRSALLLCLLLALLPARAEEPTGRVRAVYYEAAPGVLVERPIAGRTAAARWLDIELADRSRRLVQLPADMEAGVGDLVSVRLAGPARTRLAAFEPIRASRVTAVQRRTRLALPAPD